MGEYSAVRQVSETRSDTLTAQSSVSVASKEHLLSRVVLRTPLYSNDLHGLCSLPEAPGMRRSAKPCAGSSIDFLN